MKTPANQIATFINPDLGVASTVTQLKNGYAVTLLDTDAETVMATRLYPASLLDQAVSYAKTLANV